MNIEVKRSNNGWMMAFSECLLQQILGVDNGEEEQ